MAENALAHSLSAVQLRDYCTKVFRFRTVRLMRFKTWAARRKHTKMRKQRQVRHHLFVSLRSVFFSVVCFYLTYLSRIHLSLLCTVVTTSKLLLDIKLS